MAKPDQVLPLLRSIKAKLAPLARLETGQRELIQRMSTVEQVTATIRVAQVDYSERVDRLTKRVERLERRLRG